MVNKCEDKQNRADEGEGDARDVDLLALEERVQSALETGDESGLEVLGYGEVTLVLRLRSAGRTFAAKRLPILAGPAALEAYRAVLVEYLEVLAQRLVAVPRTKLWSSVKRNGRVVAYVVQPELDGSRLAPSWLRRATQSEAEGFLDRVVGYVLDVVSPAVGLDAQASNWIVGERGLQYLDVTTPLLRDGLGKEKLDAGPFFASVPWLLRAPIRVGLGRAIFDKFYDPRGVLVDLLANLHKERLGALVERVLPVVNRKLGRPIEAREVEAYYASDARMWGFLQSLRRAEQSWHVNVLRRLYPFLLARAIER
jgi:hypothetical protein